MQTGTAITQEIHVGTATFLVVVMKFGNTYRYLVLDADGQTVENEPFMRYIENMIKTSSN